MDMNNIEVAMRRVFRVFNRFIMAPMFRLGLGELVGNPFSGYIMVLRMTGHKSGKVRYVPVNYAIDGGAVYCMAGFGTAAHWYRNLRANPQVDVMLPGRTLAGNAEEVTDPQEALRVTRMILRNGGFAGYFMGFNPRTVSDEVLREKTRDLPILRIRPAGVANGPADPGGWLWVVGALATVVAIATWPRRRRENTGD
jgi:deazaflavin-dependent oxidoreductase (nitroreductase family)